MCESLYFMGTYYLLNKLIREVTYFLEILCFVNQPTIEISVDNPPHTFPCPIIKNGVVQSITLA